MIASVAIAHLLMPSLKQLLEEFLSPFGNWRQLLNREIAGEFLDLWMFVFQASAPPDRSSRGLLARIAATPCLDHNLLS
jgi:hypothetical protein